MMLLLYLVLYRDKKGGLMKEELVDKNREVIGVLTHPIDAWPASLYCLLCNNRHYDIEDVRGLWCPTCEIQMYLKSNPYPTYDKSNKQKERPE